MATQGSRLNERERNTNSFADAELTFAPSGLTLSGNEPYTTSYFFAFGPNGSG